VAKEIAVYPAALEWGLVDPIKRRRVSEGLAEPLELQRQRRDVEGRAIGPT
jgi:hypothetical protein